MLLYVESISPFSAGLFIPVLCSLREVWLDTQVWYSDMQQMVYCRDWLVQAAVVCCNGPKHPWHWCVQEALTTQKRYINPFCFGCFLWFLSKILLTILNLFSGFLFGLLMGFVCCELYFLCGSLEQTFSLQELTTTLFTTFSMPACQELMKSHQSRDIMATFWVRWSDAF